MTRAPAVDSGTLAVAAARLLPGEPTAHEQTHLPLLPSGPDGVWWLPIAWDPVVSTTRTAPTNAPDKPRAGIRPRYSGFRVQGTAGSPPSTGQISRREYTIFQRDRQMDDFILRNQGKIPHPPAHTTCPNKVFGVTSEMRTSQKSPTARPGAVGNNTILLLSVRARRTAGDFLEKPSISTRTV